MTSVPAAAPAAPPLPASPTGDAMPSQAPVYPPVSPSAPTPQVVSKSHLSVADRQRLATAIVYCEANFGEVDGKTANGLVRHSEKYDIVAVIDSHRAGLDSGIVLDGEPNAIPICFDLEAALAHADRVPDYFIFGIAPSSGMLSVHERALVL